MLGDEAHDFGRAFAKRSARKAARFFGVLEAFDLLAGDRRVGGDDAVDAVEHQRVDTAQDVVVFDAYRAKVGTNGNFILMHSVGSIPHGQEIDVPLNYADYYFLEGLMRKRDLEKK